MPWQECRSTLPSLRFGLIKTWRLSGYRSPGKHISGTILMLKHVRSRPVRRLEQPPRSRQSQLWG
jgi:hypothetical protein